MQEFSLYEKCILGALSLYSQVFYFTIGYEPGTSLNQPAIPQAAMVRRADGNTVGAPDHDANLAIP
jgi:hypothetical protein